MGLFNRVKLPDPLTCPNCGVAGIWTAQFRFGATDQIDYEVGQRLSWEYIWAVEGEPGHHRVLAQGILEGCPHCGSHDFGGLWETAVIEIVDDVIVSVVQDSSGDGWWAEDWRVFEA
ncbi:hypothetical protein AB0C18_12855 [Nonomuraea muscovyensis]|uniref:RNA polymerase subunit RPABC4/transcription elongation factor Spt4 n=1 Tax=Nonomuraea muscovyensis TaxID=1124761 RepID=A0A7X0F2F9_9ACTN|nr:hypothetical protein [Nonomuraea muscovyensis]MBB6350211.1 RNA polymerase subunit RPABC4/transcription elongation factor Spt4 [Nonomuraea muscovyensis]MDF2710697.1 hypothetical protein [Nonomuraea muscovyensis]